MSSLVLPTAGVPFVTGDELTSQQIRDLFFDRDNPTESLVIINGLLDSDNLVPVTTQIMAEHTQRGIHAAIGGIGGTANLDFRHRWFGDYDTTSAFSSDADDIAQAKPIPGGGETFFLRRDAFVRIGFTVSWTNDNATDDDFMSTVFLRIHSSNDSTDPDAVDGQDRCVRRTFGTTFQSNRNRFWSGHHWALLDGGHEYTPMLYVIAHQDIRQTRIWTRSINHMALAI